MDFVNKKLEEFNNYLDGKKVATMNNKDDMLNLERGIYIINGKKIHASII